jgi:hypothetical protein
VTVSERSPSPNSDRTQNPPNSLRQLTDLKVEEGQRINAGDIISPKGLAPRRDLLPR